MSTGGGDLIPLGKYKGQPVEVLAGDKPYVDWLVAQPDIRRKYPEFFAVIINNLQAPSETPEHNAMQAKFLDDGYCLRFLSVACGGIPRMALPGVFGEIVADRMIAILRSGNSGKPFERLRVVVEERGIIGVGSSGMTTYTPWGGEPRENWSKVDFDHRFWISHRGLDRIKFKPDKFETTSGVDVALAVSGSASIERGILIECKPQIGDDYPAILRQMRRSGAGYLFVGQFESAAITQEQFVQFFASAGIRVVFEGQVDAVAPIEFPDTTVDEIAGMLRQRMADHENIEVIVR